MIDRYDWAGGREAMLRFGPAEGAVVVAAMPLLEEWNRTRAFVVTLLRALADRGIASVLPDLPGHGESLMPVTDLTLWDLAGALEAATERVRAEGRTTLGVAVRGGALVDGRALHVRRWHLAPSTGAEVLGDLHRTWLAGAQRPSRSLESMLHDAPVTVAGTRLSARFLRSLHAEAPGTGERRVVRLATDLRPADRHVAGTPLWRRAEPGNDAALADIMADDITDWARACVR